MDLEDLLKQTDLIYDELKQLKPESTYMGGFNQRMRDVYTKNHTSPEVVYGVEFVLLWSSLDSIIKQFNDIVKQIQTKGGYNELQ